MPIRLLQLKVATMLLVLLSGCKVAADDPSLLMQEEKRLQVDEREEKQSMNMTFTQVSVITRGGYEISVDHQIFTEKWQGLTNSNQTQSGVDLEPIYTVLAWDLNQHPHVFHISEQGYKLEDWYQAEGMTAFLSWLRSVLGHTMLRELQMERMSAFAADIGTRTHIPYDVAEKLIQHMRQAEPIENPKDFRAPLYPYYQLSIEYGDKGYLVVEVIDERTFLIKDGLDDWLFTTKQPVFTELPRVSPITVYSQKHIKSLYQSDDALIEYEDYYYFVQGAIEEQLIATQWLHHVVRVLSLGKPASDMVDDVTLGEAWSSIHFSQADEVLSVVILYDDYFTHEGNTYSIQGLRLLLQDAFQFINQKM